MVPEFQFVQPYVRYVPSGFQLHTYPDLPSIIGSALEIIIVASPLVFFLGYTIWKMDAREVHHAALGCVVFRCLFGRDDQVLVV